MTDLETHLTGLMFDVSEANGGEPFDTLLDVLTYTDNVLLNDQKKGGMTIKYVQTSDNKYVEYFLTKDRWSANESDWEKLNLEEEVNQLDAELNGQITDIHVTPSTQTGYYYIVNIDIITSVTGATANYSGTVSGEGVSPTGGTDISQYVGKTLRVLVSGGSTTSGRNTAITDSNTTVLVSKKEKDFIQDENDNTKWYYDFVIPQNAKYFFWSGVRSLVSVSVLQGKQTIGLTSRVETLESSVGDINLAITVIDGDVDSIETKTDKLNIVTMKSLNLLDPSKILPGYYAGGIYHDDSSSYIVSDYIPVIGGEYYEMMRIEGSTQGQAYCRFTAFFDSNKQYMPGKDLSVVSVMNAPDDASFMKVSFYKVTDYSVYGVFKGSPSSFVPYYSIDILGLADEVPYTDKRSNSLLTKSDVLGFVANKILKIEYEYPLATISEGNNNIVVAVDYQQARIDDAGATAYDSNPLFNFYSMNFNGVSQSSTFKDDIAPAHFLGQTLGANHGQPCKKATITNHGLTNTDIGTEWEQDGVNFYVMLIIDSNNVVFLSANGGTSSSPSWTNLATGTITNGNSSLTVTEVSDYQLHPSIKNEQLSIHVDGEEITEDGTYYGNVIDFVESYDVMNPSSVLANTIARAGTSGAAVYNGDSAVKIHNVYRFVDGLNVLVISDFIPQQTMSFQDIMFSQATLKGTNGTTKYYVPNSLPFGTYDLRQPLAVAWGSGVSSMYCSSTYTKDPTKPINRVLQYADGLGFALGYITDMGVGKALFDYTNSTFELRGSGGKVYPHGVEGAKVGTTLQAGQAYNAVLYRAMFIPETSGNRLSMYHFPYNGAEYVFLDYKGSMNDHIVLDDSLNGKSIKVLEAQNATIQTDVYSGGFCVNAIFVSNETCYLVAKIK